MYKDSDSSSNPYGRFMVRQDCLGNISEIYLIGNGSRTKVAKYSYTALGECKLTAYAYTNGLSEVIAVDDVRHVANVNPFRWKGYYYDAESGLYYIHGRYYDPETGRFIDPLSPETINLLSIGGLNLYGLGVPNPLMFLANRYNCFPSLPLVFDGSESGSSGWNLPTWARIMIGTLAIIGSVVLGGIPALIGVGVGAVVGAGFEMGLRWVDKLSLREAYITGVQ